MLGSDTSHLCNPQVTKHDFVLCNSLRDMSRNHGSIRVTSMLNTLLYRAMSYSQILSFRFREWCMNVLDHKQIVQMIHNRSDVSDLGHGGRTDTHYLTWYSMAFRNDSACTFSALFIRKTIETMWICFTQDLRPIRCLPSRWFVVDGLWACNSHSR